MRVRIIPLFFIVNIYEKCSKKEDAHILRFIAICPTEVIDERTALFKARTILCIVLVNIKPKEGRIDRGQRIQHLHETKWSETQMESSSWERSRTSTSTRLVRRSSAANQVGNGGGSFSDRSSARSCAISFAEADRDGGSPFPVTILD